MGERFLGRILSVFLAGTILSVVATIPMALAGDDCGLVLTSGPDPQTSDCLFVLQAGVGIHECGLCVCDINGDGANSVVDALRCLKAAVGETVELLCPPCGPTTTTTTVTSTTLPINGCPVRAEWTTRAGYGPSCAENADCAAGVCDQDSGRCRTPSKLDIGWTGLAHDNDWSDGFTMGLKLNCEGEGPLCGQCSVTGIDPSHGACRCSNDSRILCTQPFAEAAAECSGLGNCNCYDGPPLPFSAGGTPFCMLPRLSEDVSGHLNVDTGAADLHKRMRMQLHLGLGSSAPCPTCGGTCSVEPAKFCNRDEDCPEGTCNLDPVANDGIRGGVCSRYSGPDSGKPCDIQAVHSTFPAYPGGENGGAYSLDCLPNNNASGQGLRLALTETTETSELSSKVSCQGTLPDLDCACLVCSSDPTLPCNSDEECSVLPAHCSQSTATSCSADEQCLGADVGPCSQAIGRCDKARTFLCTTNADCLNRDVGTCLLAVCTAKGTGDYPQPNLCADLLCSDLGDGTGECTTGPDHLFCSGVLKAGGEGILACISDEGCAPASVGVDARPCAHLERQRCFLEPIEARGSADPHRPVTAATFCVPPTPGAGRNFALGVAGPARLHRQASLRLPCPGRSGSVYVPGVGGCLP